MAVLKGFPNHGQEVEDDEEEKEEEEDNEEEEQEEKNKEKRLGRKLYCNGKEIKKGGSEVDKN